jgi:hypothetical protein
VHGIEKQVLKLKDYLFMPACGLFPKWSVSPVGVGVSKLKVLGYICNMTMGLMFLVIKIKKAFWEATENKLFEEGASRDCDSTTLGVMRAFCDIHCVRDAARQGDKAILTTLIDNFTILQTNFDMLLEYYAGTVSDALSLVSNDIKAESSSAAMMERALQEREHLSAHFAEMKKLLHGELRGAGYQTAIRALRTFKERWAAPPGSRLPANATHVMGDLSSHVASLLHTIRSASSAPLSDADRVAQRSLSALGTARSSTKMKDDMLKTLRLAGRAGKRRQEQLALTSGSVAALSDEIRQLGTSALIMDFDRSWWTIREKLDTYFDAVEHQSAALSDVIEVMVDYTSTCTKELQHLKYAQENALRADDAAHIQLRNTWNTVEHELGLLASRMVDSHAFSRFARSDALAVDLENNRSTICTGGLAGLNAALAAVDIAWSDGLALQTQQQMRGVLADAQTLRGFFETEKLPVPKNDVLKQAYEQFTDGVQAWKNQRRDIALEVATYLCKPRDEAASSYENTLRSAVGRALQDDAAMEAEIQDLGSAVSELVSKL